MVYIKGTSSRLGKRATNLKGKAIADTPIPAISKPARRTTCNEFYKKMIRPKLQAANQKRTETSHLSLIRTEVSCHSLGAPSYECRSCNATMWYEERNNKGNRDPNPIFLLCYQQGKVLLARFNETPAPLNRLLDSATSTFKDYIRVYNGMFCFTSFGARIDHSINVGMGLYTFRINGKNYHRIGSLLPKEGTQPTYAQLWFFDTHNKIRNQLGAFVDNDIDQVLDRTIVGSLIRMLDQNSTIAKAFRMVRYWCHSYTFVNAKLRLLSERTSSMQYNLPTVAEVTTLITNDFSDGEPTRDIVVNKKDSRSKTISELHPSYMALQYPLLFLYGEDGYHDNIPYHTNTWKSKTTRDIVTMKEYYAYIIQYKKDQETTLLRGGRLFQQYLHNVCDAITRDDTHVACLVELPSLTDDPVGYKAVTNYMLHGPCGKDVKSATCTIEGKCSRTAHSRFVIPLELLENNTCGIKKNTHLKELLQQIVTKTYPNFIEWKKDDAYLRERAILTPKNDDADAIKAYTFKKLEGEPVTYHSTDEICKASTDTLDQQHLYPIEFLNTFNFPRMVTLCFNLKKGTPNHAVEEF
ncbi:ATP-dependent DNA helicase PIF1-like protein [Tanacetum coccineum]